MQCVTFWTCNFLRFFITCLSNLKTTYSTCLHTSSVHPYIRTVLMLHDFICIACFFSFWCFHFEDFMFRRVGGYEEQRREEHYRIDCHLTLPYLSLPYLTLPYLTLNYLIQLTLLFIITLHHPNLDCQSDPKTQKSGSRLGSVEVRSSPIVTRHVQVLHFPKEKRRFRSCISHADQRNHTFS